MRTPRPYGDIGDEIAIASPGHTACDRRGEIVGVVGELEEHYLVRWADGCESLIAAGAVRILTQRDRTETRAFGGSQRERSTT